LPANAATLSQKSGFSSFFILVAENQLELHPSHCNTHRDGLTTHSNYFWGFPKMKRQPHRKLLVEQFEQRVLLDASGAVGNPDFEPVIVTFQDRVQNPRAMAEQLTQAGGGQLGHVYESALKGFSASLPKAAINALARNPMIATIEPDLVAETFAQVVPTGVMRIGALDNVVNGKIGEGKAVNVDIAIIDTGIAYHDDLDVVGGRRFYTNTGGPPSSRGAKQDGNWQDDNGHGTHVAGTAAAKDNGIGVVGVAPGARLWAVKVLNSQGGGNVSDIIAGVDWVLAQQELDGSPKIEVVNMSLGLTGRSDALHQSIKNSVNAGILYVVAAGNSYRDILGSDLTFGTADDTIPAAYPEVATISAFADTNGSHGGGGSVTNFKDPATGVPYPDDTFADFSNFSNSKSNNESFYLTDNKVLNPHGLGIDLVLPGVDILSTTRNGGYGTMTGTSMAAPHAAGLAALYIAQYGRDINGDGSINDKDVYATRQALIDLGKGWRSPEGLKVIDPNGTGGNLDSPDKHEEVLGWAGGWTTVVAPPTIQITLPAASEVVSGVIVISGTASLQDPRNGAPLNFVTVQVGSLGPETATLDLHTGDWTYSLGTDGLSDDNYLLIATANYRDSSDVPVVSSVSASQILTIQNQKPETSVLSAGIVGSSAIANKRFWQATATVTVSAGDDNVEGATVTARWSNSSATLVIGTTNSAGQVVFQSSNFRQGNDTSVGFEIVSITKPGFKYTETQSITINAPGTSGSSATVGNLASNASLPSGAALDTTLSQLSDEDYVALFAADLWSVPGSKRR
jgi:subtilisin family serine protease